MGWQSWRVVIASAREQDGWRAFLNGLRCPSGHDEVNEVKWPTQKKLLVSKGLSFAS